MFFKLIKRDHATHYTPLWLPLAVPIGVILAGVGKDGLTPAVEGDYIGPVVMVWLLITFMLGFARVGLRADRLTLTLPMASRVVWLARLVSTLIFVFSIIIAAVVFMVVVNNYEQEPLFRTDAVAFLVALSGMTLLAVALIQVFRPSLREIPVERRPVLYLVLVWLSCLTGLFMLLSAGPVWTVVPVVIAGVLFLWAWRKLPGSFVTVGAESDGTELGAGRYGEPYTPAERIESRKSIVSAELPGKSEWRRLLHLTILGSLYRPVIPAAIAGLVLGFLGFYVSGYYPEPLSGPVYLLWIVVVGPAFMALPLTRLNSLDHMPLSRRRVFPYVVLPSFLLITAGFMGGTILGNTLSPRTPLSEYWSTRECPFFHRVPDRFLEIAWNNSPPAIVAPWGEVREPWTCRPVKGHRATMYSPFSLPQGSSREFVAWQLSREIRTVYQVEIPPEIIEKRLDRYFERDEDGYWRIDGRGDAFREDFRGLSVGGWGRSMATIVLILGVVWFLQAAWLIRTDLCGMSPRFFTLIWRVLPAVFPVIFIATLIWLGEYGYTSSWKLTAVANILVRQLADALPANPFALWALVIVVVVVCYFIAEALFRRAQVSHKTTAA